MSPMAFLDHPDLVRVAPVPTPRRVLGGQDLNLGCELKVDHNVGLIIASNAPSDGPRRSVTNVGNIDDHEWKPFPAKRRSLDTMVI